MQVCVCACVCMFVCASLRLFITSGMIRTPCDWLNKIYSCCMAIVVGIVNGHDHLYIDTCVAVAGAELRCHAALPMPRRHASFTQQLILTTTTKITI